MKRTISLVCVFSLIMCPRGFANNIKEPNVSGQFYDADPARLARTIDIYLTQAAVSPSDKDIQILISPHAGYPYSGPIAAYGYKAISKKTYKTVVVLAPSHFFGFAAASVWKEGGFRTPLGVVNIDEEFTSQLAAADPDIVFQPQAFEQEHSLEVQLPFLQTVLKDFRIVPIIMGQASCEYAKKLADALDKTIANRTDVLIVVSSDMSHFFPGKIANALDIATLETIQKMDIPAYWEKGGHQAQGMCGYVPVATAMALAKKRGLAPEILKHATSGDVTGDDSRVVGYSSVIFYPGEKSGGKVKNNNGQPLEDPGTLLSKEQKKQLIEIAQKTINEYIRTGKVYEPQVKDPRLNVVEGAFVTLKKNGELRGCIGNIIGVAPLNITVRNMAISASTEDPRFSPVTIDELASLEMEISVLSKPQTVINPEEIQPGVHGVIVQRGGRSGVFLPQVATEWGWNREQLLSNLCSHKAGLPADAWKDPQTRLQIFTAQVFSENDVQ